MAGNEAKNQTADLDVITNRQPTHDSVEATPATDKAAPDASGDKSTSVSNEVDTAPAQETHETTPAKAVPEPELGEDPAPNPPPTDASAPPPVPEKETAATNKPTSTSEETSASPSQIAEPSPPKVEDANETEEPSAQPTEPEAPATENADSSKPDAVEEVPKPQSDGDGRAVDEGSATQDGDGKANGAATKLTLRTDRVRELSTASMMSSSSSAPGTPAEEVASSAVDEEEVGTPDQPGTSAKSKKKKKKKKNKGEKNSPRPPSGGTVSNADNSTVQDCNPPVVATTPPADIPNHEGEGDGDGELVEKVASGDEDTPVMVDKVDSSGDDSAVVVARPQTEEVVKAVDGDSASVADEWDWTSS